MFTRISSTIILLFACWSLQAQYLLKGSVKDSISKEPLAFANVYFSELERGVSTDIDGRFSISLPQEKSYTYSLSYMGYIEKKGEVDLSLTKDVQLFLSEESTAMQTIQVKADELNDINSTKLVSTINVKELKEIPAFLGEVDVYKSSNLLPGISGSNEGRGSLFVRGGNADHNLVLLDNAIIYNPSHLMGFFSIFNADALHGVEVWKGGMPTQYAGRLASVMDVKMKEPDMNKFNLRGSLGLVLSKLAVEVPIWKERIALLVAVRKSYVDEYFRFGPKSFRNNRLNFFDLNTKIKVVLSPQHQLSLSAYWGRDYLSLENDLDMDWGNLFARLSWKYLKGDAFSSQLNLVFTSYDSFLSRENSEGEQKNSSTAIKEYFLQEEAKLQLNDQHLLKFGGNSVFKIIEPGKLTSEQNGDTSITLATQYALESGLYISDHFEINDKMVLSGGLRFSLYNGIGPYEQYFFEEDGLLDSTANYPSGKVYQTYYGIEPRLRFSYQLKENLSLKLAYSRMYQYVHLLANSSSTLPTDVWMTSTRFIRPEIADQMVVGLQSFLWENRIELGIETYYKILQNQIDYINGADIYVNPYVESQLLYGRGRAYGVELFAKKHKGKFTGWLSYTYSRTQRKIDGINRGNWYSVRQDRPHDLSLVGVYRFHPNWSVGMTWVYRTGDAVTMPSGSFFYQGQRFVSFSERNAARLPDYHRMDFSLTWKIPSKKRFKSELNLSVYNLYARENTFVIDFGVNKNDPSKIDITHYSLTNITPSITWSFKF